VTVQTRWISQHAICDLCHKHNHADPVLIVGLCGQILLQGIMHYATQKHMCISRTPWKNAEVTHKVCWYSELYNPAVAHTPSHM